MFTDTERELNTIAENLANFAKAIVDFIEKLVAFFETLTGKTEEEEIIE